MAYHYYNLIQKYHQHRILDAVKILFIICLTTRNCAQLLEASLRQIIGRNSVNTPCCCCKWQHSRQCSRQCVVDCRIEAHRAAACLKGSFNSQNNGGKIVTDLREISLFMAQAKMHSNVLIEINKPPRYVLNSFSHIGTSYLIK